MCVRAELTEDDGWHRHFVSMVKTATPMPIIPVASGAKEASPAKKQRTAAEPGGDNQRTERAAAAVAKGGRGGKGGTTSGRGEPASEDAKVLAEAEP